MQKCLLKDITFARMNIELLKVQLIIDLVKDYQEHNYSIVIFVNYIKTLKYLSKQLNTENVLYGKTEQDKRIKIIDNFQKKITDVQDKATRFMVSVCPKYGSELDMYLGKIAGEYS